MAAASPVTIKIVFMVKIYILALQLEPVAKFDVRIKLLKTCFLPRPYL